MDESEADQEADLMCDPIKVFIKDEPHKLTKIQQRRMRVIWCLSLVDQVVDRMLFIPWLDAELQNVDKVTSKAGWSPLPCGFRDLIRRFPEAIAVDKTAWDWTMPDWCVRMYFRVKCHQMNVRNPLYMGVCRLRFEQVLGSLCRVRMPDGLNLRQKGLGIMKSGWLMTLSMNSAAQMFQHSLAMIRLTQECRYEDLPNLGIWAMGDDVIMDVPPPYYDINDFCYYYNVYLETTGCVVKHVYANREFSGFMFLSMNNVTPLYGEKHKFLLKYLKPADEQDTLMSYALLYSKTPNSWFEAFHGFIEVPIQELAENWADGLIKLELLDAVPFDM